MEDRDGEVLVQVDVSPLWAMDAAGVAERMEPGKVFEVGEEVYLE